jgi:hypothetical protein
MMINVDAAISPSLGAVIRNCMELALLHVFLRITSLDVRSFGSEICAPECLIEP